MASINDDRSLLGILMAKWLELDRKLYGLQEDTSSSGGGSGGGDDENWKSERKRCKKKIERNMLSDHEMWELKGNRLPLQIHLIYFSISYW